MAMRELLRVTLDAKLIREACEAHVARRIDGVTEEAHADVPNDLAITVVVSKRRSPRKAKSKANGVASALPLSEAEQRFA